MIRTLSALAMAAVLAVPAFAAKHSRTVTTETVTTVTIPASEYARLQDMGYSTQDIFWAYNTSSATNRKVDDILVMRKNGESWDQIAKDCGCSTNVVYGTPSSAVLGTRTEVTTTTTTGDDTRMRSRVASIYGAEERPLGNRFYREGYRLTPRDYHRFRTAGYTRDEVFMIANAARHTGIDPEYFANMISRGNYARQIASEFNLLPGELTHVQPEWRTPEWAAAVHEPVFDRDRLNVWW